MKRVIMTGATGTIGTALIKKFVSCGIEVLVISRKNSERNLHIPRHPLVSIRYCDLGRLRDLVNDTEKQYDVFYHLAWAGTFGDQRNDLFLQTENIKWALDAVRAAKAFGCHTFIGAGSQAEYGRADAPLTASTPAFPENGYGYAKLCAGYMTRDHAHQLGMKHIWVRVLSVYGENSDPKSIIPALIAQCVDHKPLQCTSGEQVWDFLYSEDAARALLLLGEKGKDGKTYVLGSGEKKRLSEYIKIIRDIAAPGLEINFGAIPYNKNQVMYLCADIEELKKDTGFEPEIPFEEGIRRMYISMKI